MFTRCPMTLSVLSYVWMKNLTSCLGKQMIHYPYGQMIHKRWIRNTSGKEHAAFCVYKAIGGMAACNCPEQRQATDWAEEIRHLLDECYPGHEKIILVMDNLNILAEASLYKQYKPDEARRLAKRLEIHHTPVHGSWLNIAEIELNAMTRQCLARRIDTLEN